MPTQAPDVPTKVLDVPLRGPSFVPLVRGGLYHIWVPVARLIPDLLFGLLFVHPSETPGPDKRALVSIIELLYEQRRYDFRPCLSNHYQETVVFQPKRILYYSTPKLYFWLCIT